MNILFVCLGNICRSPIAEGILMKIISERNITAKIESAGFESFHINEPPDKRAIKISKKHGIDISNSKCRLFNTNDFDNYDKIYVMDSGNFRDVQYFSRNEDDMKKVLFLLSEIDGKRRSVPDPFDGGEIDFEKTFNLIEKACDKIADLIEKETNIEQD